MILIKSIFRFKTFNTLVIKISANIKLRTRMRSDGCYHFYSLFFGIKKIMKDFLIKLKENIWEGFLNQYVCTEWDIVHVLLAYILAIHIKQPLSVWNWIEFCRLLSLPNICIKLFNYNFLYVNIEISPCVCMELSRNLLSVHD